MGTRQDPLVDKRISLRRLFGNSAYRMTFASVLIERRFSNKNICLDWSYSFANSLSLRIQIATVEKVSEFFKS